MDTDALGGDGPGFDSLITRGCTRCFGTCEASAVAPEAIIPSFPTGRTVDPSEAGTGVGGAPTRWGALRRGRLAGRVCMEPDGVVDS